MGTRKRRRFTEAFKQEAVRLCLRHDRSIGQVARELDLTESAVRNWVKQYEVDSWLQSEWCAHDGREDGTAHAPARGARVARGARDLKKSGGLLRQGKRVRFAWIHVEKATYAVRRLCRVLAVTPSGYYAWMHRLPSQRARDNDRLQVRIRAIHAASRGTYGSPRVHEQLTQEGCAVGRERVARLLRDMGLVGLPARRVRHTTDSTHGRPVAPNVLERHFEADHPNQRWTTDITFIWTWEGWLYLAVVLDLYARRVVGWAVQPHLQTELALEALQLALGATRARPRSGAPFRSGLPVCRRGLSACAARAWDRLFDEPHGGLLGQRRHRELLCDAQDRAHPPPALAHAAGGHGRRRGLHRRLLQSVPAALVARVSQPQRIRKTACAKRNVRSIINLSTFPREDHGPP